MPDSPLYAKLKAEARAQRRTPTARKYAPAVQHRPVNAPPDPAELRAATVPALARVIAADWAPVNYAAVPYLRAMAAADYGLDGAKSVVLYFLSNAKTWRGDTARAVKAELRRRYA